MIQLHTGSLAGLTAIAGLIPTEHLGIYIFGNLDHAELRHALMYKAFDLWAFNDNSNDWSNLFYTHYKALADTASKNQKNELAKKVLNTRPSLPPADYTGKFVNKKLASVEVVLKDSVLTVLMPANISISLQHWHYDVFRGSNSRWWLGNAWVQFLPDKAGKIVVLKIDGTPYEKVK